MREYICNSKKIILLWSPKVACTTLHNWFITDICEIDGNKDPRILADENKITHKLTKNLIYNNFKNYTVYFFVRDPILRCISCFINKFIVYRNKKLTSMNELEQFSKLLIKNYDPTITNGITFNEYLKAIEHGMKNKKIDIHFNLQVDPNTFPVYKKNNKLIIQNINSLNKKLNEINKKYNIKEKEYSKTNCSPYKNTGNYKDITNIKCFDINLDELDINNFKSSFNYIKKIYNLDYKYLNEYF